MKKVMILAALASAGLSVASVAVAQSAKPQIVERDARGRATKVQIGDKVYDVCTSDNSDGCINPREAGLGYGNNTAKTWPGRPISREN